MDIFREYADVREKIDALKQIESQLSKKIVETIGEKKTEKTPWGKFVIASRSNYTFSEKVDRLQEVVDIEKEKEKEKGIAKVSVTNYLRFDRE